MSRELVRALVLLFALLCAGNASAHDDAASSTDSKPAPHYLRAVLEESGVLVAGAVQYSTATSNSQDWDLGYNWPSLRAKLTGQALRFDTNHFDTNMMTHPAAGTLYYLAARSNRLSVLESFLFATASSTLWEYLGEFRELASVNDLIVTPISGVAFGEALTQLGAFFDRSKATPANEILGALFGPATTVHDALDATPPTRDADVDSLGFTRNIGHHFALRVGAAAVNGDTSGGLEGRFALRTEIVNVTRYDAPGSRSAFLTDTLVSRLDAEGAVGQGGVRDVQLDVLVAPLGYYAHDLSREHGRLVGQRFLLGATLGFDYGMHAYRPMPIGTFDRIAGVHAGGITAEYTSAGSLVRVRTAIDVRPEFAAVQSFAIDGYYAHGGDPAALPSVALDAGYYFAAGSVLAPSVDVGVDRWTLGAQARFESYWGIEGLDRRQAQIKNEVSLHDRRTLGRVYVSWLPVEGLDLRVAIERRERMGEVADISVSRSEWALVTSAGVLF